MHIDEAKIQAYRETKLQEKLDEDFDKFWGVVAQLYEPEDDGESESTTISNIAKNEKLYIEVISKFFQP